MNFKYEDRLPRLPAEIVTEIYKLIENYNNTIPDQKLENEKMLSIPDLQLNLVNQEILDSFQNCSYNESNSLGFPIESCSTYFKNLAKFDFLVANEVIAKWTYENITPKPALITIQVIHGGPIIVPHVDESRSYVYNYLLDTGNAVTKFYKNSIGNEHLVAYPQTVFTYDRIEEIETINIEKNRWHYLDVSKIHNVENIQSGQKRISLSLSYV